MPKILATDPAPDDVLRPAGRPVQIVQPLSGVGALLSTAAGVVPEDAVLGLPQLLAGVRDAAPGGLPLLAAPAISFDTSGGNVWTFTWQAGAFPAGASNIQKRASRDGGETFTTLAGVNTNLVDTKLFDPQAATSIVFRFTAFDGSSIALTQTREVVYTIPVAPTFTVQPTISPSNPLPGQTVTLTEGVATGVPAPTLSGTLTLGGVPVTPSGLTYTLPLDAGGQSLVWTVTASNGAGNDLATATTSVQIGEIDGALTLSVEAGEIEIDYTTAPGATHVEVDVQAPPAYVGSYVVALTALEAGPVNLVPPSYTGTPTTGQVITPQNGLWLSAGGALVVQRELVRGALTVVASDFDPYTIQAADMSAGLDLRETANDANGSAVEVEPVVVPVFEPKTISVPTTSRATTALASNSGRVVIAGRGSANFEEGDRLFYISLGSSSSAHFVALNMRPFFQTGLEVRAGTGTLFEAKPTGTTTANTLYSYVCVIDIPNSVAKIWVEGATASVTLTGVSTSETVKTAGEILFSGSRQWWGGNGLLDTRGSPRHNGAWSLWTNWAPEPATLAAVLFDSTDNYEWFPWAADGTVNVGGTDYSPDIHFIVSAANWDAGANFGTGPDFVPTGGVTEI